MRTRGIGPVIAILRCGLLAAAAIATSTAHAEAIDGCLVGTWEVTKFTQDDPFITGGGTGLRVTFTTDGTETVDYSTMEPVKAGADAIRYSGNASARIVADKGIARLEAITKRGVTMTTESPALKFRVDQLLLGLGPGGLGTAAGESPYTCSKDSLEYRSSASRDGKPNTRVTLTRIGSGGALSTRERPKSPPPDGPCHVSDEDRRRAHEMKERAKRWRETASQAREAGRREADPRRRQSFEDNARQADGSARLNEQEAARILCETPAGTVASEPAPPTRSTPPTPTVDRAVPPTTSRPPQAAQKVCGPDVTRNVLAVMREIYEEFKKATPLAQRQACTGLVDPLRGSFAWDIRDLFERSGAFPKNDKDPGIPSAFGRMSGGQCCTPSWPCGPTVSFFGTCHNQQVVNYVMWGVTRSLCSLDVNIRQPIVHRVYSRGSENRPEQNLMADVGEKYSDLLKANDRQAGFPAGPQGMTNPESFPELKRILDGAEATSTRVYKQCAVQCDTAVTTKFTFRWLGLNKPLPSIQELNRTPKGQ